MPTEAELERQAAEARAAGGAQDALLAGVLCDLADLKMGKGKVDEAQALLQEAYGLRKGAIEGGAEPAPRGEAGGGDGGAGGSGGSGGGSEGDAWDNSDEWEPDLSNLKSAAEFEAAAAAPTAGPDAPGGWRSSGGGGGFGGEARPRGRGTRKAHIAEEDADDWNEAKAAAPRARDMPHVVELHGLNRSVTTTDLELFLLDFHYGGLAPSIRWVDDEHALAVFPCKEAADALLASGQKAYGARPYSEASAMAHERPAEELVPPRAARPKTTTAVARRLIGQALGNSAAVRDKAAEAELASLRRAKREERRVKQQSLAEAWGDD